MLQQYLNEKNITQVCESINETHDHDFSKFFGYNGKKTPTLFFGVSSEEDLRRILCHKALKTVVWRDSVKKIKFNTLKEMTQNPCFNRNLIEHLYDSKDIEDILNSVNIQARLIKEVKAGKELYENFVEKYEVFTNSINENNQQEYDDYIKSQEEVQEVQQLEEVQQEEVQQLEEVQQEDQQLEDQQEVQEEVQQKLEVQEVQQLEEQREESLIEYSSEYSSTEDDKSSDEEILNILSNEIKNSNNEKKLNKKMILKKSVNNRNRNRNKNENL